MNRQDKRQGYFDRALEGLRKQGCQSIDVDNNCKYRDDHGNRCAIGWLIPDDKYDPEMENLTAIAERVYGAVPLADDGDSFFLRNMQRCLHDAYEEGRLPYPSWLEKQAQGFAARDNLAYSPPKEVW